MVPLPPMTPDQQAAYDAMDPIQQALCDLLTAALIADVQAERTTRQPTTQPLSSDPPDPPDPTL